MRRNKTFYFVAAISILIFATSARIGKDEKFKNLKILPKDISEKKLDSIMNAYNNALKVTCDFCHIKTKQSGDDLDFAADGPMKESGRKMIQLMMDINTKYFYYDSTIKPQYLNAVSCNTCHRGNPFPMWE